MYNATRYLAIHYTQHITLNLKKLSLTNHFASRFIFTLFTRGSHLENIPTENLPYRGDSISKISCKGSIPEQSKIQRIMFKTNGSNITKLPDILLLAINMSLIIDKAALNLLMSNTS